MKEVGDKFGAGELILPFVLQSAEVMKRAVAQLEKYLDKLEGYTKGTVVLATVFGDVHDIGKSLVNTILTNNGYAVWTWASRCRSRRSSTPRRSTRRPRSACRAAGLDVQADAGLHPGALRPGPRVPGADRRRGDQPELRPAHPVPERERVRRDLRAGRVLLQGRVRGLAKMDQLVDADARGALVEKLRDAARRLPRAARRSPTTSRPSPTTRCAAPARPTCRFPSRRTGACARSTSMDEVYRHLDTHVLFKLHWGGRGVKGEAWRPAAARGLPAAAGAHVARAGLPPPARASRLLPVQRAMATS